MAEAGLAKRPRLDGPDKPNTATSEGGSRAAAISAEQRARIEHNRQLALERRKLQQAQQQPTPQQQPTLSQQQQLTPQQSKSSPALSPQQASLEQQDSEIPNFCSKVLDFLDEEVALEPQEEKETAESTTAGEDKDEGRDGESLATRMSSASASFSSSSSAPSSSASSSDSDSDSDSGSDSTASSPSGVEVDAGAQEGTLSEEQRQRIEQNRIAAQRLRTERNRIAAQRLRTERNRMAALERRKEKLLSESQPSSQPEPSSQLEFSSSKGLSNHQKEAEKPVVLKREQRNAKQTLVAQLLCRWWYVLPDWPPEDDNFYEARLHERKLRSIDVARFHMAPEVDHLGRTKVFPLSGYKGLYRDAQGNLMDLRPKETCPSYDNMMQKQVPELHALVVKAYEVQLAELEAQPVKGPEDKEFRATLRKEVKKAKQKATFGLMFYKGGSSKPA